MISFLNALILYALPAIAIPFLIHLFTKQKLKKISFSTLEFLKEMRQEKIRSVKIKQILLIIIRTLIVLLLILAFARPTMKEGQEFGSTARSSVVIILDNSLSMARLDKGVPLFEIARKKAFELVEVLKPGDEVYLLNPLAPGKMAVAGPKYNPEAIKQTIFSTSQAHHATDLPGAILQSLQILANSENLNREIYLISDLQASAFPGPAPQKWPELPPGIRLYLIPVQGKHFRNIAVREVTLINQILENGKTAELAATMSNLGDVAENNRLVQLFVNGKRSGQTTLDLKPGESRQISFKFTPNAVGFQSGSVLLEDDDLARDNRRHFSFYVPEEIWVLLVGNKPPDTRFLQWALNPSEDFSGSLKIQAILNPELATIDFAKFQVVVLSNIPQLKPGVEARLLDYVSNGGGLLVALGSDVDVREYNQGLLKNLNLPNLIESVGRLDARDAFISFGKIDFSHPIFQTLFENEKNIDSPHFYFSFKVARNALGNAIMHYNNNYPFLLESQREKGRVLLVTTAVDPAWSDWPVKGIFAPLVNRCVSYLAGSSDLELQELLIGQPLHFVGNQETGNWEMEVATPDQRRIRVRPQIQQSNLVIQFDETTLPGIYQLVNQNAVLGQWAVNFDPAEAEVAPVSLDLPGEQYFQINANDDLEARIIDSRYGRELWKFFLFAALILIFIEMLLFWERKNPADLVPESGTKS
jgi:hypothetical protein